MKRRILFITGTRADFGKLKPLMKTVEASNSCELYLFVTGMHLLARYGLTYNEVLSSGFKRVHPYINQRGDSTEGMDAVLANTVHGLSLYVKETNPDVILVHGDRLEALAGAIVGAFNNILVGHIEGGEVSGTIDELIRHSTTKLSHLHFVANDEARQRLIQMGERSDSIYVIGSPDIDVMLYGDLPTMSEVKKRYGIQFDEYCIVLYHPVTTELEKLESKVNHLVNSIIRSSHNFVIIYPNNDVGSNIIQSEYSKLAGSGNVKIIPSMRFEYFLTLLKHSKCILGNSSAGIREAPVYAVPTINLGTRQNGRFSARSIINIDEDAQLITEHLKSLPTDLTPSRYFGAGDSAQQFINIIDGEEMWRTKVQKRFVDLVDSDRGRH